MSISVTTHGSIEWRDSEMQDAIDFLEMANPKGYTADEIKRHAIREFEKTGQSTFVGTAGWYVSIVRKSYESETPFIALVSIMPYTAKRYADEFREYRETVKAHLKDY